MRIAILIAAVLSGPAAAGRYDATLVEMCEKIAGKADATKAALLAARKHCEGVAPLATTERIQARIEALPLEESPPAPSAPRLLEPRPAEPRPALTREQLIAAIRAQAQGEISECGRRIELSRTAIAREKRVAAESGYEDARLLHWLGQQIIACQEVQAAARKRLEEIKTNPDAAIERAKPAPPVIANGGRVRPPQ